MSLYCEHDSDVRGEEERTIHLHPLVKAGQKKKTVTVSFCFCLSLVILLTLNEKKTNLFACSVLLPQGVFTWAPSPPITHLLQRITWIVLLCPHFAAHSFREKITVLLSRSEN